MVEKANSTKRRTSNKFKKTRKAAAPLPRSAEMVSDDDGSSGSEEEENTTVTMYTYQPPQDFTPLSSDALQNSNPFSAANLKGKQLWLITAPADAPLSKLPYINAQAVAEGAPVMETKSGKKYCLKPDEDTLDESARANIMVPDSKGVYREAGQPIVKAFRVVESLPKPPKSSKEQIPAAQPVRLQPDGLRMRYRPFGAVGEVMDAVVAVDAMDVDEVQDKRADERSPERKKKQHKSTQGGGEKKKKHGHKHREGKR